VRRSLNQKTEDSSPLMQAIEKGHLEIAKMLVDHGADCNWLRKLVQDSEWHFMPMLKHPEYLDFFLGTEKGACKIRLDLPSSSLS